ncbi:hypothetical protein D9M71_389530 [compost metagenome]
MARETEANTALALLYRMTVSVLNRLLVGAGLAESGRMRSARWSSSCRLRRVGFFSASLKNLASAQKDDGQPCQTAMNTGCCKASICRLAADWLTAGVNGDGCRSRQDRNANAQTTKKQVKFLFIFMILPLKAKLTTHR